MKPLYFLTHEDNPSMFSGYGIPISKGKSPLAGILMIDRPSRCPESYIQKLKETFDEVIIGPMAMKVIRVAISFAGYQSFELRQLTLIFSLCF